MAVWGLASGRYPLRSGKLLWLLVLVAGNALLLTPSGSLPRVLGALVLMLLPGLLWVKRLFPGAGSLVLWSVGAGLSYTLVMSFGLILHYLPGPIPLWAVLVGLNALALVPLVLWTEAGSDRQPHFRFSIPLGLLLLILCLAAAYRFTSLGYSEFQGDEIKAMLPAAKALEGNQDILEERKKGPGEVLVPMILWRLTGTINEGTARLPFAIAGLLALLTIYLLGGRLLGERAALVACWFMALNGFMVGFSRVVQYQSILVWMSVLVLLCAWMWRETGSTRWAVLIGAFLGTGLLLHYDGILVVPALAYTALSDSKSQCPRPDSRSYFRALAAVACSSAVVAGPFYVVFVLHPTVVLTGGYLAGRLGLGVTRNNLNEFLTYGAFYCSFWYIALTGLLVFGLLLWALHRLPEIRRFPSTRYLVPVLASVVALGLTLWPGVSRVSDVDLAVLPFGLILLGAFLSPVLNSGERTVVAWLAVPFLGYTFLVHSPRSHFFIFAPAWTLLAGLAATRMWDFIDSRFRKRRDVESGNVLSVKPGLPRTAILSYSLSVICVLFLTALFGGYLYSAYLRHDVNFLDLRSKWSKAWPNLYSSPYRVPRTVFALVRRGGWKVVGALYADGRLSGDYDSNESRDVTTWYARKALRATPDELRACGALPEYYFIADDFLREKPVDVEMIKASYDVVGGASFPEGKGFTIYQVRPSTGHLGNIDVEALTYIFDSMATPSAFAAVTPSRPMNADIGDRVRLIGYDLDTRRAQSGGRVAVTLYWQVRTRMANDYHVFVHLRSEEGTVGTGATWGQSAGRPVCWSYPTNKWIPGEIVADRHIVALSPDTPAGEYSLVVGMYRPETGVRLEVVGEPGSANANSVKLATIPIR